MPAYDAFDAADLRYAKMLLPAYAIAADVAG